MSRENPICFQSDLDRLCGRPGLTTKVHYTGDTMSYLSLYQQLSIEFLSDPDFDHARARDDAFALCARWRQTHGRHVTAENISAEFGHWWRKHYADGLRLMGSDRSYHRFMHGLSQKLPDHRDSLSN